MTPQFAYFTTSRQAGAGRHVAFQLLLNYKPLLEHMYLILHWFPVVADGEFGGP